MGNFHARLENEFQRRGKVTQIVFIKNATRWGASVLSAPLSALERSVARTQWRALPPFVGHRVTLAK